MIDSVTACVNSGCPSIVKICISVSRNGTDGSDEIVDDGENRTMPWLYVESVEPMMWKLGGTTGT